MPNVTHVLIVEDQIHDYEIACREILRSVNPCAFERAEQEQDFLQSLEDFKPDVILSDYNMPAFDGMRALKLAQQHLPSTRVIIWTGAMSEDVAVDCMKEGASNYVIKDNIKRLGPAVVQALKERNLFLERTQAQKKYQDLFENSDEGIFRSSPNGRYVDVNPAMARIYGYASPQEMIESINDVGRQIYMDSRDYKTFLHLIHESGVVHNFETKNRRKDGSVIWTATTAHVVHDEDGNVLYYEGFLHDITERISITGRLAESEKRFRAMIENAMDNISLLAPDGTLLWENQSTNSILGYGHGEFVSRNIFELMHPEDQPWTRELFAKVGHEPGSQQRGTFRLKRHDGSWRWIDATATNMLNNESVQAIVINYRDVTQRKLVDEELRESERRYRFLFENNPLPMWIYDLETLRFLQVNDAAVDQYGYSVDEFLSMSIKDIRPAADVPILLQNIAEVGGSKTIDHAGVWRHLKKDGTLIYVDVVSHPMIFSGRKAELVLAADVTARYTAEIEIQHRNDDLGLVNQMNEAINRGQNLDAVVEILRREVKRIFSGESVALYLLTPDGKSLKMQQYVMPPQIASKVDALIGHPIPQVEIPIREGGYFHEALLNKQGRITSDPVVLQKWMEEFTDAPLLPHAVRAPIRKLIPQIFKLINIKSTILIPLVWEEKVIGFLDISGPKLFTTDDLNRIENIAGQLTTAIHRNRIETALKEERNLLRTLIDNLPDRVYVMDAEGRKTLSNLADWKSSGVKSMEDIIGKTDFDVYPPELAEPFWQLDRRVLESGEPVINYEEPGLDPDGNIVSILSSKIPLRNDDGQVIGLVGVGRDITERKRAEAQINELLNFNETILSNSPVGILTYKITGECIFANERAAAIVGTDVKTLRSQNFHNLGSWRKSGLYNMVKHVIETGTVKSGDFHHVSSFGKEIWLTVSCITFRLQEENHVLLSISDITERMLMEQALRESEKRLNLALAGAQMGAWEWNLQDNSVFWSPECFEIIGVAQDEFDGRLETQMKWIHPDDAESMLSHARQMIKDRSTYSSEFRVISSHGDLRWLSNHGQAEYDASGTPLRLIGIVQNITLRKRAEDERQAVFDIMQGLTSTADLDEFLKLVHQVIGRVIYAQNLFVVLHNQVSGLFEEIYSVDQYDPPALPSSLTKSITSYVYHLGEPLLLTRDGIHELVEQGKVDLVGTASASWLGAPLKTSHGTIGIIAVQDYENTNRYTEQDRDFFSSIASQVAVAVERKQAEKELNNAQEFLQGIQNSLSAHMAILDQDGVIVQVNRAWEEFGRQNGWEPGKPFTGFNYLEICDSTTGPDAEIAHQAAVGIRDILAGRRNSISMEYPCHAPTEKRWFTLHVTCFDDGTQKWAVLAHENITERVLAEESVHEKTAQFHALFEASPDAIILIDPQKDWSIIDCNSAACKMNGYTREELVGQSINILNGKHGTPEERAVYLQKIKANNVLRYEDEHIHKNGTIFNIEVSTTVMQLGGRDLVLGIDRDITHRKRAEQELRNSEERFRQLATNIEEVFWMTDAQTGAELYISPAVKNVWGVSNEHFLNTPNAFIETIMAEDRELVLSNIERQKRGEKTEMEYRVRHSNGTIHWVWDRAFPIFDEKGNVVRLAGIAADITQRKQSDLEIERYLTELHALYENGLSISRLLEPKEIGSHIIQTFARYLSWHHVAIRLLNPENEKLELIAFNQPGLSDESRIELEARLTAMVAHVGEGLSGWVMQTGKPLRTGNVHTHPQYVDTHAGIMSGLYMPLNVGELTIGVISVESEALDAFSAQDERLLATLANQAAIAFENARLYQSAQLEIAERRRAQEALRLSESHYRELADSITDILFELDHDLRYIHWNKASEIFSGITAEEAIGRSMEEVWGSPAEDVLLRKRVYQAVLQEQQAKSFETEILIKEQKRYLEINAYPSARGVSVVAKDVTERKLGDIMVHKRLELVDYSGKHHLNDVIQRVIDQASELTESHIGFLHLIEADEVTIQLQAWSSETLRDFCRAEGAGMHYPSEEAGVWADALRQRKSLIHNDYAAVTGKKGMPEGHAVVNREMVVPIFRSEKIVALIGVGNKEQEYSIYDLQIVERFADYAWDIVERKQMENALADERNQLALRVEERTADLSRANSNLARALRVKDEFLANMSHELRTPLNAILGLSESLSEQVAGPLNEKQQKYLSTINESGHHLLSLINDILDLAKIEAGQITLDINKVNVNGVCQASLRMIKQLAQRKNQEVSFEIDDEVGLMWADERRLKQMIVNLLSNAVKFTPDDGKLGLEVRGDKAGNRVIISVWDQGVGISEADMQRLFKPFVQLDAGLAREASGTGLGLALVAQMAKLHGGSVNVESQVGKGSRFTILLPWEPAMASESGVRLRTTGKFRAIKPGEERPTILLIEDTNEVVMMLVDYLEMAGFNMVTAQDGIDGLTQAKLYHPNLILMDIQMPRMDGFETTKKLRSDPEFKETPIIALTALAMPNDRNRCLEAGMNEYLSKPVNLKTLAKTIKAFLYDPETNQS